MLLPPTAAKDTSVEASIRFYHGGGRWVSPSLSVEYGFIDPEFMPDLERPANWLPGETSCLPVAPGWEGRIHHYRDRNGIHLNTWLRQPAKPRHWLFVSVSTTTEGSVAALNSVVASIRPDSTLWAR